MSEPIPAEAFYDLSLVQEVALSPDGDRVAFVADEFDPVDDERRSSLFVAPTDGSRDPHRLTRTSDAGGVAWSPDGSKLGFVAAREEDVALQVGDGDRPADGHDGAQAEDGDDGDETAGESGDDATDDGDVDDESAAVGPDEPKPQVWVFDMERGGDARQVTDREEGVGTFDWSPDGDRIVVAARDPTDDEREYLQALREEDAPIETERLQHKADGQGWLDSVTTYLFVVDVETREERRLDAAFGRGAAEPLTGLQPSWGPGGRIAFVTNRSDRPDDSLAMDLHTIAPDGSDRRRLTDGEVTVRSPEWSPDGEHVAFGHQHPDNWCIPTDVRVIPADGGEMRSLSGELDRTLSWMLPIRWADDETVVAGIGDEGNTRLIRCDVDGGAERVFERQGDDRSLRGFDLRGDTVALVVSHPSDGIDVFAMDVADLDAGRDGAGSNAESDADPNAESDADPNAESDADPLTRVTDRSEAFVGEHPTPGCTGVAWEHDDGGTVEGWVYHPPGFDPEDPDEQLPLVLNPHGGPTAHDSPSFRFTYAYWTSRGYLVFAPNYRGSTSYGREFCETIRGEWGTKEVDDVLSGVDHLVDRGWADPDRLFCTGFSYGGITTGYVVTRTDRFAAAAAEHGIYDMRSLFGTDDTHNWLEADFGLPWENPEAYAAASSITDVGGVETPLLVTAGEEDWRCPPSQSEQLYVSVRKQGTPAKLVVYRGEHHNVGDPDRAIHRIETVTGWFEEHDPAVDADD